MPSDVAADEALGHWLEQATGVPGPFRLQRLTGGNSNETLLVTGSGPQQEWILRRPPVATVDEAAHDMSREYRVLSAVQDADVPSPGVLGLYVEPGSARTMLLMQRCPGVPLAAAVPAEWTGPDLVAQIGEAAVDALVALHAVDWRAAGLEEFGRPDGYLERQVGRWRRQYEQHRTRDLPLFDPVAAWLERHRPPDIAPALLHGDFHLDNALFVPGPPVRVSAIIDWELSTIGDPLVDLGLFLAFWGNDRPSAPAMPRVQALSRVPGAPTRKDLAGRYAAASGRSVEHLDWYLTLAFFKLAAIVEGAYARYTAGDLDSPYARDLATDVPRLLEEAAVFAGL
ncbi:phosphotransferase [Nakamurella sp. YIM 132087]|uniref:Phosphotransferase n=1 Tax=Nakamurella alba TaxID=2665158 RepID=A0A7K1FP82_9ACTN|nr:phosphotransferase family protein [Nakamurella alba]MTD15951.1 phosphotransferase [Nakamurella alba]